MRNRNGIFWGLFLLLGAAILVVSQLHLITYTFSFWSIVATLFLVAILIKSMVYVSIPGTVFSLAFLAIMYAKPLHIQTLVPWTILGAALLISIGLSMIFRPLLAKHRPWMNYHKGFTKGHHGPFVSFDYTDDPDFKTVDAPDVNVYVRMGNSVRYVKSDDLHTAAIDVSMGDGKVYFENVGVKDEATINIHVSLGNLDLYVPSNWNVVKAFDNNMSNLSEFGAPIIDDESPLVRITGVASMANLKIHYI